MKNGYKEDLTSFADIGQTNKYILNFRINTTNCIGIRVWKFLMRKFMQPFCIAALTREIFSLSPSIRRQDAAISPFNRRKCLVIVAKSSLCSISILSNCLESLRCIICGICHGSINFEIIPLNFWRQRIGIVYSCQWIYYRDNYFFRAIRLLDDKGVELIPAPWITIRGR